MTDEVHENGDSVPAGGAGERNESEDVVKYATYSRTVSQLKKTQSQAKELEDQLAQYKAKEKAEHEQGLVEQQKFDEFRQLKEKEVETLKSQLDQRDKEVFDAQKLQAVVDTLPGKLKKREYLGFIDTSMVELDPENGTIVPESVQNAANAFLKHYGSDLLDSRGARLPGNHANGAQVFSAEQELAQAKTVEAKRAVLEKNPQLLSQALSSIAKQRK